MYTNLIFMFLFNFGGATIVPKQDYTPSIQEVCKETIENSDLIPVSIVPFKNNEKESYFKPMLEQGNTPEYAIFFMFYKPELFKA